MKNINRILLIILGIGLIAWATYLIITAIPYRDKESEESIVKCFDKHGKAKLRYVEHEHGTMPIKH